VPGIVRCGLGSGTFKVGVNWVDGDNAAAESSRDLHRVKGIPGTDIEHDVSFAHTKLTDVVKQRRPRLRVTARV
jgi:hypothetical protein